MKKILIAIIVCLSLNSVYGQDKVKISELPVYTGTPAGALVPVVVGGINRKMDGYYFASMKIDSVWFVGNTLYVKKNGVTVSSDHTHPQSQITNLADSLLARYTKTQIEALLTLKLNISDSAAMLSPYARTQRLIDSLAAAQSRLQTKEPLLGYTPVPTTITVNGHALSADVTVTKSDVGLGNVPNVDATNASNISSGTLADARLSGNVTLQGNSFNGANQLVKTGSDGKLLPGVIPALALVDTYTPASQAAMLALPAEQGDIAIRTDINVAYILYQAPASTLGNWIALPAPSSETDPVFTSHVAFGITATNISNWSTAYGWGNWAAGSHYIGTTLIANNRASASQILTGVSIDGNAATVTNGVYTTGSYPDPTWITSLAYSKLTGAPSLSGFVPYTGATTNVNLGNNQITALGGFFKGDLRSNLNGSNTPGNGAFFLLGNTSNSNFWLHQLNASNGIDWYYYNGTYTASLFNINTAGLVTLNNTLNVGSGAGVINVHNIAAAQGTFFGYSDILANRPGSGKIAIGAIASYQGVIQYYDGGQTALYIDNTYNDAASVINFRLRTSGTPVTALSLEGSGVAKFYSSITAPDGLNTTTAGTAYWTKTSARLMATDNLSLLDFGASTSGHTIQSNYYGGGAYYSITMTANPASYASQFVLNTNGTIVAASSITATAFYETPSDIRKKTVVRRWKSADGIDQIEYYLKNDPDRKILYGYEAQQVMKVIPSAVMTSKDATMPDGVSYSVGYTQVSIYKIAQLEQRIYKLEKQLKR